MNTISKRFNDMLFNIGYWIGFKLHRRPAPKAVAMEPVRPSAPVGTTGDWFAPTGPRQTWDEALAAAAQRQQAKQPLN